MKRKLMVGMFALSFIAMIGCNSNDKSKHPTDKDGNPTNLMPESRKSLEFNAETIVSQLNKNLPDIWYYDYHFDSARTASTSQVNYYMSRTKTAAEKMITDDFAKTQKEADCKEYKTSTAWYYEERRKRHISIEFHWNDNAGKDVCKHVCSN
ncbi:MAG: hypothetical protein IPL04_09600 [Chitinophagaceae bacterium]|nr:hypothetical protein [Chitinophagaceae bacterium]